MTVNSSDTYLPGVIFIPSMLIIEDITRSYPMLITFTVPDTGSNTYRQGQLVRLNVPYSYGMYQANGLTGEILDVIDDTMLVNLDSRQFDLFNPPAQPNAEQPASLSPSGSRNLQYSNTTNEIAFQPLNNRGN